MPVAPKTVLFLCTGNSARSIFAEALLNDRGKGVFQAFSAGSHPKGEVHPLALDLLRRAHLPTDGLRSKSWNEFGASGNASLDFVFTVCGNAAAETCPVWPGQPVTAHWGVDDPAAASGSPDDRVRAFERAFYALDRRIRLFVSLRFEALDRLSLRDAVRDIGER